ncbi:MAG: hypothetical protein KME59_06095 [Trichormus sp. ATA11-4-KO1]|nr:hypothetical protein [Trichormus sp. ATA11-4-KO1]
MQFLTAIKLLIEKISLCDCQLSKKNYYPFLPQSKKAIALKFNRERSPLKLTIQYHR